MKKFITFLLLSLLTLCKAVSQTDTEFWFAAPEVSSAHGDEPIYLRISTTSRPAEVSVSMPANSAFSNITKKVTANSTVSIALTKFKDEIEGSPANKVLNKGLNIKSTSEISCYYKVANVWNPAIYHLKGNVCICISVRFTAG